MNIVDDNWVKQVVLEAGRIITGEADNIKISVKGTADFVTQTDCNVQNYIKESLQKRYPHIGFMGEEEGMNIAERTMQWILDPIDGTTNYIYGYRHSAISLALRKENEIILGFVYNPFTEEFFFAKKGEGAFLNGSKIQVNPTETLEASLVSVGTSPYYKDMADLVFEKIKKLYQKALDIRRTGSAALDLAYLACGRQDVYFEYRLKPWDYAAGSLLVKEAGGVVEGIGESSISYETMSDIAACTNGKLMEEVREII